METQEQAVDALIADQVDKGCVPTQPAWGATLETPAGWAVFNANGYLGTVTGEGSVVVEDELIEDG